jgi:hypothetical protein
LAYLNKIIEYKIPPATAKTSISVAIVMNVARSATALLILKARTRECIDRKEIAWCKIESWQ